MALFRGPKNVFSVRVEDAVVDMTLDDEVVSMDAEVE